ncbi:MAG: hypothetical protein LBL28_07215 [Treponema sp.]|jgi:hypothetical protein|nr:hypothetical protein [Treponema sp.]
MSFFNVAGGVANLIQTGVSFAWAWVAAAAAEQQDAQGLLAAYRFELESNLELLGAVKQDALADMEISSPDFRALVESLHTEIAVSILYSADRKAFNRFAGLFKNCPAGGGPLITETEDGEQPQTFESVTAAMAFTIRKIEVLKNLVRIARPESPLFPRFRLAARIGHIKTNLATLRKIVNA